MDNELPDGAKLRITYREQALERNLFVGYLIGFGDGIPISPESRGEALSEGIADIALASVSRAGVEVESINEGKIMNMSLGDKVSVRSKKYGEVEVTLLGVRVNADESNFDQWITA